MSSSLRPHTIKKGREGLSDYKGNDDHKKKLKELRELILVKESPKKEDILSIYNNNHAELESGLNTVFWEVDKYSTILIEYITWHERPTPKTVQLLINLGANINICTAKTGECNTTIDVGNAILWAMTLNYANIVNILAKNGATNLNKMSNWISHLPSNMNHRRIMNAYRITRRASAPANRVSRLKSKSYSKTRKSFHP